MNITLIPNTRILFSNISKKDIVCPDGDDVDYSDQYVNVGEICENDISWTMFEKIDVPFRFRAEQCYPMLYALVVYPPLDDSTEQVLSISADYIDSESWFTVTGGIHEEIPVQTDWGKRSADMWESTVKCALITCQYPGIDARLETVWLPRHSSSSSREEYWALSGLKLVNYGSPSLDQYGALTVVLFVVWFFVVICFWAGWFYNFRIYQNKKPPFRVPKFWPACWFPQPAENNYAYEDPNESGNSFDVLDNNQRGSTKRGTTKYRAPQFYFEDD